MPTRRHADKVKVQFIIKRKNHSRVIVDYVQSHDPVLDIRHFEDLNDFMNELVKHKISEYVVAERLYYHFNVGDSLDGEIDMDEINEVMFNYQGKRHEAFKKILKLNQYMNSFEDYDDFTYSEFWKLIGVTSPSNIISIECKKTLISDNWEDHFTHYLEVRNNRVIVFADYQNPIEEMMQDLYDM